MDIKNKKKIRDYAVKGLICISFAAIVYFGVFATEEKDHVDPSISLNTELPDGKTPPLEEKKKAYENEVFMKNNEQRMKTLNDYVFELKNGKIDIDEASKTQSVSLDATLPVENPGSDALRERILGQKGTDDVEYEYQRVQLENENLHRQLRELREQSHKENASEEQLAMIEKSYELAARYSGKESNRDTGLQPEKEEKRETVEVTKKDSELTSTLSEEILEDAPYNFGFITAAGSSYRAGTNTIRACVAEDQTVTAGQRVMLRLLEPLQAGSTTIPRNHLIAGTTRIQGDRMNIQIENIEYAGNIIPVELKVYDTDGMPGIYCPGSPELDALKEGAANIGSSLGTSISFTHSAGQQVAMDLTRGVMNGASQYLSKKMRTVKVTLKSNYEVLLLPKNK